jgi:hypothetical protein
MNVKVFRVRQDGRDVGMLFALCRKSIEKVSVVAQLLYEGLPD